MNKKLRFFKKIGKLSILRFRPSTSTYDPRFATLDNDADSRETFAFCGVICINFTVWRAVLMYFTDLHVLTAENIMISC